MRAGEFEQEIEDAIHRDDPIELMDVVLRVAHEAADREWAQSCCVQLARHRSAHVRGNAIAGFGHLARRFGRLDPNAIKRRVDIALHDLSPYVREQARSAAEDLETFLEWEFDPPPE
jgi:hypothetical protein